MLYLTEILRRNDISIIVGIKWPKYLVLVYHIHIFSSKISMYNVINMKVVKSRRHLGHKHDYVSMFASPVKYVVLQVTVGALLTDL